MADGMSICSACQTRAILGVGLLMYALITVLLHTSSLKHGTQDPRAALQLLNGSRSISGISSLQRQSPLRQPALQWSRAKTALPARTQTTLQMDPNLETGPLYMEKNNVSIKFNQAMIEEGLRQANMPWERLFVGSHSVPMDSMSGVRQVLYPATHTQCGLRECRDFTSQQQINEKSSRLAVIMPSAPRIIRSPAVGEMWGSDGIALRAPAWLLKHNTTANQTELSKACSRLYDCDGYVAGLGLLAGVSGATRVTGVTAGTEFDILPVGAQGNVELPGANLKQVRTLAPTTAEMRLHPVRPSSQTDSSALRQFAVLPVMQLAHASHVRVNISSGRTLQERLELLAQHCLAAPQCIGFSKGSWGILQFDGSHASLFQQQAESIAPKHASNTTKQIAQLFSAVTFLDQTKQKTMDMFVRLPDPTHAADLVRLLLERNVAPAIKRWGEALLLAAKNVYAAEAESSLTLAKPDKPCPVFREPAAGHEAVSSDEDMRQPAACGWLREAHWVLHSGSVSPSVKQAVRDLYAILALRGAPTAYVVSSVLSFLVETQACRSADSHVYVGEVPALRWHHQPHTSHRGLHLLRLLFDAAYAPLYGAWAWNPAPCVTVLSVAEFAQLQEQAKPPHAWGEPWLPPHRRFLPNGAKRIVKRKLVQQVLDFASLGVEAVHRSPTAALAIWEDDCFVCGGSLSFLYQWQQRLVQYDPRTALLKVGNGGSGIVVPQPLAKALLTYIISHRGRENIDVLMYLFALDSTWSDYLAHRTLSAHRGRRTSLKINNAFTPVWGRVECGNALDFYWGEYAACGNGTQAVAVAAEWKCSAPVRGEAELAPPAGPSAAVNATV